MSQEVQITEINNRVPKGPRYQKGTLRSKVFKGYLKVQGIPEIPGGKRYPKGT